MEYRLLGRSGLKVSTITMGTMTFGGVGWAKTVGDLGIKDAKKLVDMCIDAGVNLLDTADVYSQGASEEILGEIIGGPRKNGVLIATKARFPMGPGVNDAGSSRQHLIQACEASLKRMKTDVIDLYQLHEWDGQTPLEETMEALDTLVRQGKVRYIGCSNFSGWHIMKALGVSERDKRERFVSQQIHYTLEARDAENELVPVSIDQGLGILVWSPIAGGLLSGKHRRNQATPEGTRQFAGWTEPPIRNENRLWNIVDRLVEIADGRGVSAAQVALAWLIGRKGVTSVIIGGRTEAQFKDNLASAELKLTDEERKRLDDVSLPPLMYPYWHQRNTASDRLSEADLALIGPHLAK
ncbi:MULTISPECIES: aldo/keto reductase [Rhizobium]|uniref:Aldo/keto reductase n=1 Tax=Rhizobium tropici TaxID=398 RepID=A0A329Y8F6_RHITR|nr:MULTISPECIES: aldo/keto reductase [Rhizobium]MBB3285973.1 aryl-alcohol dehydrogenase-like predicted oxidoreductase [Rhizobium sp. BK252]MBB3400865.1 aryl-alcohol dehydrogenase-like predicted oxidoreductase [Rhizobium sp. BK289]MBB3413291.1 aryl-alcohol dehydrogenase-like predicted oxidoreductase [Rhizobium sp. BK284]MBB3481331.1 aryl-alcohol dehydrogenase-like predicted oxidoreductase [Rhizobium sp. BK347]MDK4723160.1 aldo/keto reductase [Rhizobium sp. CNPSo 3968]